MINGEKVGVGIVTYNRQHFFKKCFLSVDIDGVDELIIIDDFNIDGKCNSENNVDIMWIQSNCRRLDDGVPSPEVRLQYNDRNLGVGASKNEALTYLLDSGCDHIFLIEDDMLIKDPRVFEKYIEASKVSGIQHMMFAYHGPANKNNVSKGTPTPRLVIFYNDDVSVSLNQHCVGSFCYYTRKSLEDCGLIDEKFKNAFDHVSHSYELALKGYSTPYWWWADLGNSYDYIDEQACSEESSTIKTPERLQEWRENIQISMNYFKEKFGVLPFGRDCVPDTPETEIFKLLKELK